MTTTPHPARVASLIRQGVAPHIAAASAKAQEDGIASRKRFVREAAKHYDRKKRLPGALHPLGVEKAWLTPGRFPHRTRDILRLLAHRLRYHRTNPLGRVSVARSIQIAMVGEAAILRRQTSKKAA